MNGKIFANVLKTRLKKTLATSTGTGHLHCIILFRSQETKLTVLKFERIEDKFTAGTVENLTGAV